jgi:hypothetical protein
MSRASVCTEPLGHHASVERESMKRRILALAVVLLCGGVAGLLSSFDHVRIVDAVRLSGSGFALGAGFTLLCFGLAGVIKEDNGDPARSEAAKEQERQTSRVVKPN